MSESELPTPDNTTNDQLESGLGVDQSELRAIIDRISPEYVRYISCDPGWNSLLIDLDKDLAELSPNYTIAQVKEKFGTLRFYILSYDTNKKSIQEKMDDRVMAAENLSGVTCEACGSTEKDVELRSGSWLRTLCNACEERHRNRFKDNA